MKNFFKKIGILVVILVLSYLTAPYFGNWYNKFSPQYGGWLTSNEQAISFAGFFIAYIFFIPLAYGLFGIIRNKYWMMGLLLPVVLLMFAADRPHFYIPVLLIIIALMLAWIVRLVIFKFRHPNPPMVVK
jgi:hypothetical protein